MHEGESDGEDFGGSNHFSDVYAVVELHEGKLPMIEINTGHGIDSHVHGTGVKMTAAGACKGPLCPSTV